MPISALDAMHRQEGALHRSHQYGAVIVVIVIFVIVLVSAAVLELSYAEKLPDFTFTAILVFDEQMTIEDL